MFSASENSSTRPRRWRSSGMWPTPASSIFRAVGCVILAPVDHDLAAVGRRRRPVSASISSLWPLPSTPARPTISPARTSNETSAHRRQAAVVVHAQVARARAARRPAPPAASRRGAAPRGRPSPARALPRSRPHAGRCRSACRARSTVIRSAISSTSFSLWLMKMIERAARPSAAMIANSSLRLLRRQHGGRLVEDQDLGAAVERLQDLDPLLLADADVLDLRRSGRPRGRSASRARAPRSTAAS